MMPKTIPQIELPFCSQSSFEEAVRALECCYMTNPVSGFVKPFFAPGGVYGWQWWSLDYALAVEGAKWLDFSLGEDMIENLCAGQCADGRIKLLGSDDLRHIPNVREEVASLPKYFESAYRVACMSEDLTLTQNTFTLFEKSLNWWFQKRQDEKTKLLSAVFEETVISNTVSGSGVYAPMDTNIEVALGCQNAARLAARLGNIKKRDFYLGKQQEIFDAVEHYLWNEEKGCYFPYILSEKRHYDVQMASLFLGFYLPDRDRHEKLRSMLLDDAQFNWEHYPLTTVSKKDPLFVTPSGDYSGNPCWSGSVWTLTNEAAVKALRAAGEDELAARLAIKTIEVFRDNYAEFVNPFTRSGEGVKEYGWTASQFISLIIEEIFGISYSAERGLTVRPTLPAEYADRRIAIRGLALPNGQTVSVECAGNQVKISE